MIFAWIVWSFGCDSKTTSVPLCETFQYLRNRLSVEISHGTYDFGVGVTAKGCIIILSSLVA